MKLFILSNEIEKSEDPTFNTSLSEEGKNNFMNKTMNILKSIEFDEIYSSPFIKTLETIYPFVLSSKNKIKIDYSLSDVINDKRFKENPNLNLTVEQKKNFLVDKNYNSLWNPATLKYKERNMQVKHRLKMFLSFLNSKYEKKDLKILICTHQNICIKILNLLSKNSDLIKYDKGKLSTLSDSKIVFLN